MTTLDTTQLIGWFLGAFGIGYISSFILRVFRRAAHSTIR